MKNSKSFQKKHEKRLGTEKEGLLVATFGATGEVEDADGQVIRCHLRKNMEPVITGDRVLWLPEADNSGLVVDHLPRTSLLAKPEHNGKMKPIAANIDAMIIVTAPPPALSEYLIDRHLIAAENLNVTPIILLNKADMLNDTNRNAVMDQLAVYEKIGYRVILSSTKTQDGITQLLEFFHNKTCVLVGVSGVGKSSIISTLIPQQEIRVGDISASGSGKHTTTMTRLYRLPQGGSLIDSPGIREFGLWHMSNSEIAAGFVDFHAFADQCKFRNCQHIKEPGCAVQKAIEEKKIEVKRFESYKKMISEK